MFVTLYLHMHHPFWDVCDSWIRDAVDLELYTEGYCRTRLAAAIDASTLLHECLIMCSSLCIVCAQVPIADQHWPDGSNH